jgi:hypothetical protein
MKTERRHELQTNELAVWLTDAVEVAKPYARLLTGIVLAAVVLSIFYVVMTRRSKEAEERGWTEHFIAAASEDATDLEQVAREHPGTTVATWSHIKLGDRHLNEGIDLRFRNRAKAEEELRVAEESYQAALADAEVLAQQRATLGLARVYETQQEFDKARKHYQALKDGWPEGVLAELAARRLADLERQRTKEFYDWFAKQDPKPPLDGEGLPPGSPLPFDLDTGSTAHPDITPPLTPGAIDPTTEGDGPELTTPADDEPGTPASDGADNEEEGAEAPADTDLSTDPAADPGDAPAEEDPQPDNP